VLFPNRGTRTTAIAWQLESPRVLAGAQFFVLRPDLTRILPEFLAWFIRSEKAVRHFEGRRKGTYVQIIQRGDLAELEMPLPSLVIQQRIVDVAHLALTERLLAERLALLKSKLTTGQLVEAALECGASAPLFLGQPRLPVVREPRLASQSGTNVPHSKQSPTAFHREESQT